VTIKRNTWYAVDEVSRVYTFPGKELLRFDDVTRVKVSDNHTHYLELGNGENVIVKNTWLAVQIDGIWIDETNVDSDDDKVGGTDSDDDENQDDDNYPDL